jgi:hypothetical protein
MKRSVSDLKNGKSGIARGKPFMRLLDGSRMLDAGDRMVVLW